jgi:YD repeat-containing protein
VFSGVVKGSATSAANGTYSISNLDPGAYEVWITAGGFSNDVRQGVVVTSSSTSTVNAAMSAPGSISGTITQSDGVTPIAGAAISAVAGSVERGSASTSGSGAYTIGNLHPGSYSIRAVNVGYRTREQAATVVESSNVIVNLSLDAAASGPVSYAYDELGQLVQVTDQSGDSAIYRYDAVGNIVAIERAGATAVTVSEFTPNSGPVGTIVTVYGTGFSSTPAQNTVAFACGSGCSVNGTVTSASPTRLVTSVPATAVTGAISVTSPNGAAISGSSFVVGVFAPSITGFTPSVGVAGTQVFVSGTNFETTPPNDRTKFNLSLASVSAATTTSLTAIVPTLTGSGPISVATPAGSAVSATDFYVPPSPYVAGDVLYMNRIAPVNPQTVAIGTANKIGLVTFAGTAGQRISLNGTNGMSGQVFGCDVLVSILKRDNTPLAPGTCMESNGFIDATALPATGTYTILVDPGGTATGSVTLTLYSITDYLGSIVAGGSPVTVPIATPGQNGALTFTGTAGQRVSLGGTGTISGQVALACDVNVSIVRASGNSTVAGPACMEGGGFIDTFALPANDTYKVIVDPYSNATGNLTLTLNNVTDISGTIAADGTPVTVSITTQGQNAALTFTGAAAQRISLVGTGTISGQVSLTCDVNVSVVRLSDNLTVGGPTCMEGSGFIDTVALPTSDTYKIVVDPYSYATGDLTLRLYTVPADLTGTLAINAAAAPVSLQTPGQNASFTFSVASSQQITVRTTNNTVAGAGSCVTVSLLNGGTTVTSSASCGSSFNLTPQTLAAGSYTVTVDPIGKSTGSLSLQVTSP